MGFMKERSLFNRMFSESVDERRVGYRPFHTKLKMLPRMSVRSLFRNFPLSGNIVRMNRKLNADE